MRRITADAHLVRALSDEWELTATAPGQCLDAASLNGLSWSAARVPGTAAMAMPDEPAGSYDGRDWWFRTRFDADPARSDEEIVLALDGIATVGEVYLNRELLLRSGSMFAAHTIDIADTLRPVNELAICCRALSPLLDVARRPRARWRSRLVSEGNLRFFRTMLLGRTTGAPSGPPVVGPWRPIRLERRRCAIVEDLRLRPRVEHGEGVLALEAQLRGPGGADAPIAAVIRLSGRGSAHSTSLSLTPSGGAAHARGELRIPDVERWWPHTHGAPNLYQAAMIVQVGDEQLSFDLGRIGFRELSCGGDLERDGIQLRVNDVPVFARGAIWTPAQLVAPAADQDDPRELLCTVADAGMNMLRVPGTACYERAEFYDGCDELGILVWQDFMFANLDYPEQDEEFMSQVRHEVRDVMAGLAGRPSLAVLCGSSEVAQQVAMLGLDPALADGPLFGETLPSLVREAGVDAAYLRSAPVGGDLPFRTDRGVTNYYGVGAYRRPLEDVRRSEVRFAAECLAFANVPDEKTLELVDARGGLMPHNPAWKAGVPRDAGAGWDFDDVRDHYLRLLFDLDPVALRSTQPERYLELSRALTGEVMAEVFGEWRRGASPCGGGLVLWLRDLLPGAGWGVLDHRGMPKAAYWHLRRALAPIALWSTDEGLGGIVVHVANDGPEVQLVNLRVALYRDLEMRVAERVVQLRLEPHSGFADNLERLLGRFVDVGWAYRFGEPAQDLIVMSLEREEHERTDLLSQAFRLPVGRPRNREPASRLGARATLRRLSDRTAKLIVSSQRLLYGARISIPGFQASDDAFSVEPGHAREVDLVGCAPHTGPATGALTALNLSGRVAIEQSDD